MGARPLFVLIFGSAPLAVGKKADRVVEMVHKKHTTDIYITFVRIKKFLKCSFP